MVFDHVECDISNDGIFWSLAAVKGFCGLLMCYLTYTWLAGAETPAQKMVKVDRKKRGIPIAGWQRMKKSFWFTLHYLVGFCLILVLCVDFMDSYYKGSFMQDELLPFLQRTIVTIEIILLSQWFHQFLIAYLGFHAKENILVKLNTKTMYVVAFVSLMGFAIGLYDVIVSKGNAHWTNYTQIGCLIAIVVVLNAIIIMSIFGVFMKSDAIFLKRAKAATEHTRSKNIEAWANENANDKYLLKFFQYSRICGTIIMLCVVYQLFYFCFYQLWASEFGNKACIAFDYILPINLTILQFMLLLTTKQTRELLKTFLEFIEPTIQVVARNPHIKQDSESHSGSGGSETTEEAA